MDNNNKQKIKVEISAVASNTDGKIGWAWTSDDDSKIKPASGVIESPPAGLYVLEADEKEWRRDSNLRRYGEYVALKAFFADFLVALYGQACLDVTDDPNVQKLLSTRLRTCDSLDEVAEVEIVGKEFCSFLTGEIQETHEALRPLWLSVVMDVLNANCGIRVRIEGGPYGGDEPPAWHAARAALGFPSEPVGEPFDITDDGDELVDVLQTRLSSISDASASDKPAEETLTPGEQGAMAEIQKAVDVLGIASRTFADAKHKVEALTPGQEGYTAAVAEAMRAKAAMEGAMGAASYAASMFDREMKKVEGEVPTGPGHRVHLPDGREGIIAKLFPQGEVRDGHVLDARWWVTLGVTNIDIGTTVYVDGFELREDGAYWPKHRASEEAVEPKV